MKTRTFLLTLGLLLSALWLHADETVTVTATSADISENLDLKTVATLFGQAKDLEQFENMLNNPDSAFSNLDLNGDGQVDYLRVIETADGNRHLVVIQAVLARDVYQDVASIFVEKDPETESVTVQVIGDEYIYGTNYIIEPVYVYRPYIYDWFWGPDWVCWYSPWYWDYWPHWWHPYYCVAPYLYWDRCYWHHYHYPICSYRTGYHAHSHYQPMYAGVSRSDYAARHPERSFSTRNASRGASNARAFEVERRNSTRKSTPLRPRAYGDPASAVAGQGSSRSGSAGVSTRSMNAQNASRSFGSTNIRTRSNDAAARSTAADTRSSSRSVANSSRGTNGTSSRPETTSVTTRSTKSTPLRPRTYGDPASTPSRASSVSSTRSSTPSRPRTYGDPASNSVSAPTRAGSSSTSANRANTTTTRSNTTATRSSSSVSTRTSSGVSTRTSSGVSTRTSATPARSTYNTSSPSRSSGSSMRSSSSSTRSSSSSGGSYGGGSRSGGRR